MQLQADVAIAIAIDVAMTVAISIAILIALETAFIQMVTAVVAIAGAEVIFLATARAMVSQLAAGHREEQPLVPLDQLHVANDEGVVEGQGAERLEAVVLILGLAEFNPDVGQAHRNSPC